VAADYSAQILVSFGFFTSPPPFIPGESPVTKLIWLVVGVSLFIFLRSIGSGAIRSIASIYRCSACNRRCEETPPGSEDYVCPHCGPTPPTCESVGGLSDVGCMIGMALGRKLKDSINNWNASREAKRRLILDIENELNLPTPDIPALTANLAQAVENGYFNKAGDILARINRLTNDADKLSVLQTIVDEENARTTKKFAPAEFTLLTNELTRLTTPPPTP